MNILRRLQVIGSVIVGSAAAGAGAGLLVAGMMLATQFGHANGPIVRELLGLGFQTGALFGLLAGPPVVLGLLRRVPIGRLAASTSLATAYGGLVGYTASFMFAQPRPTISLVIGASVVGFSISAIRLRWQYYRERRSESVPSVGY